MAKLPVISAKDAVRALAKCGYALDHQTGSHLILRHKDPPFRRLTVPNHKELAKGTLRSIIRQAGLTREEFAKLLE
jgi:predicted RNA binding protein YcfA (HicA-like mRNA interferase family)